LRKRKKTCENKMLHSRRPSISARILSIAIVKSSRAAERASLVKPSRDGKLLQTNPPPTPLTEHFDKVQENQKNM
jgi:hypothetical protein